MTYSALRPLSVLVSLFAKSLNRAATMDYLHQIEHQRDARREAEEQLKILIETSPVAIMTTDQDGCIVMANEAAHRLLGVAQGELPGRVIFRYLPSLTNVSLHDAQKQLIRAVMQARGQQEDGETFLAENVL